MRRPMIIALAIGAARQEHVTLAEKIIGSTNIVAQSGR
jgi:hypothetical protein